MDDRNLPAPAAAGLPDLASLIAGVAGGLHAEQDALNSADPWARADAQANRWLRSPRFSDGTRYQYAAAYRSWRLWCAKTGVPPLQARRVDLEGWTTFLAKVGNPASAKPRPLSRRSVARMMAAISSYYRRAISDEVPVHPLSPGDDPARADIVRNPVPPQDRPKVRRRSRQPYLSPEEIRALIAAADADSPRSAALVALLLLDGVRISEALGADVEDITRPQQGVRFLRIIRKGDKGDEVPLPPPVWQRVQAVVADRRSGPLLATRSGRRMDRKAAWQTVRRLGRRAGIDTPIGNHTLRHAFITRGHELHIPVAELQDAAGHESVDTTRGYDRSRFDPDRHPAFVIAGDLTDT